MRALFTKYGGNLGATGSSHMFAHVGEIMSPAAAGSAGIVLSAAIDAGAPSMQSEPTSIVTTSFGRRIGGAGGQELGRLEREGTLEAVRATVVDEPRPPLS